MTSREINTHLSIMKNAAMLAAKLLMRRYGQLKKIHIRAKSLNDFVTVVDHKSQQIIIRTLRKSFPAYGYLAEERGVYEPKKRMWVIDPLDGTANYIHQFPLFCISIALTEDRIPIIGLVLDPIHKECFTAVQGKGASMNGRKITVSSVKKLSEAFIATGFPFRMRRYFGPYNRSFKMLFYRTASIRRGGSAALDLCYAACGRVDGFWEFGLSEWDIAAGSLIVKEAGGLVTDFKGKAGYLRNGNVVAGNRSVQPPILSVLKRIRGFRGSLAKPA